MSGTISEILAHKISSFDVDGVPRNVRKIANGCIIDVVGVMLAGAQSDSALRIMSLAEQSYAGGESSVIGSHRKLTAPGAALVNGAAAHALDFDDNSYAGIVHGSAVVFPAALAIAQQRKTSGRTLLDGFIVGLEAQLTFGRALTNSIYDKGWWTTSVLGGLGAAITASYIMGLNSESTARAISLVAVGTGAVRALRGTDAKHYYCGRAAEAGVMAAMLAESGAIAPKDVFEDQNGFLRIVNDATFDPECIDRIGIDYSLENPGIDLKKYPICYASHAAADAMLKIMSENELTPDRIAEVTCLVPPVVASNLTFVAPTTSQQAQFSMQFTIASAVMFHGIRLEHLEQDVLNDPALREMMSKVEMRVGDLPTGAVVGGDICPEWSIVQVKTTDGLCYEAFAGAATGSASQPLTDDMIEAKFHNCAALSLSLDNANRVLRSLREIGDLEDSRSLFDIA